MNKTANPAMTFIPNFPPCLQNSTIPEPDALLDMQTLLSYLPRTGTIGLMVTFYFTFAFSQPYDAFVPEGGIDENLYFGDGDRQDPRNLALIRFRESLVAFMNNYQPDRPQIHQWPLNVET